MEKVIVVQRIHIDSPSPMDVAIKYYSILSILNNIKLTKREIQLLSFVALKGSISSGGAKESFRQLYGSSKASIGNMVWRLSKRGILLRNGRKMVLNPRLALSFEGIVVLHMTLTNA